MKFHNNSIVPSPRRVRIFMAEKGISIPTVEVDFQNKEQLTPEFRALNPWCTVPVLELDDGTAISEVIGVCRYLEEAYPEPPLMGIDARDKGIVAMWDHRVEIGGTLAAVETLRNSATRMIGRAIPGPLDLEQIPALAERGRKRLGHFLAVLDERLADSAFIAGERYTIADITAMVALEAAARVEIPIPDDHRHLLRWHDSVNQRPSAAA